ncbi:MAG: hypothetical protein R2879_19490 [Saprospiraceae bacterium]
MSIITRIFLLFSMLSVVNPIFGQTNDYHFEGKVEKGNFYLLKGTIAGSYAITMKLFIQNWARCGEEWKAIQHKNGGIDGWYQYDRIGEKIPLTGSYLFDKEVRIFVPGSEDAIIDSLTCEMENYKEVFWNDEAFDPTLMNWKMKGASESKPVSLNILHKPVSDTLFIIMKAKPCEEKIINISNLIDKPEIDNIQIISYSKVEDQYHILLLENNGWREYRNTWDTYLLMKI